MRFLQVASRGDDDSGIHASASASSAFLPSLMGRMSVIQYWNSDTTASVSPEVKTNKIMIKKKKKSDDCFSFTKEMNQQKGARWANRVRN